MLGKWRYHQGIIVVPWLAMVWVYKQELWQVEAIGREKSNPSLSFSLEEKENPLSSSFFYFFTSCSRIACTCWFSFGLRPSVLDAVHGQWVHRLAGLRRCVSLLRIPFWHRALMRWSRVRIGSCWCVIPGCFAKIVGGARGR